MRYEDITNGLGESEVVVTAAPQTHQVRHISRDDWATYMAEPLRVLWDIIRSEKHSMILEKADYADFEEFCWVHSKIGCQKQYSKLLCSLDGMQV